ncbi:SCP2 sterol-binding domain-containing protein [Amycolatopsis cihanbeyliensis]|uniref:SCP-2 sterol transfer family protein n=1 Tax=Amycolatopsis cihanbeyliensis TaxID=1128664 RepID=A0A542DKX8_AMYCI|nr:SCP2 sterol-binding domain-containing protein [Amycolatopsis cihanbeyliensis]TQJ03738.1 SCP-2 sterol transfer family protein [Amycolatopsis cihanbeyliensis]
MVDRTGVTDVELAGLRGRALIETLERIDPARLDPADVDVNALAAAVDPAELGKDDFRRLLAALSRVAERVPELDLGRVDPKHFATLVARASRAQLDRVVAEPPLRAWLLGEIFDRMSTHLRQDRAAELDAVVHWRLSGGSGAGGYDRYETVIRGGSCTVRREMREQPRVTITVGPADFFQLITHQATPAVLFVTGKIKVKGDLAFAAGLIGFFDLPEPG